MSQASVVGRPHHVDRARPKILSQAKLHIRRNVSGSMEIRIWPVDMSQKIKRYDFGKLEMVHSNTLQSCRKEYGVSKWYLQSGQGIWSWDFGAQAMHPAKLLRDQQAMHPAYLGVTIQNGWWKPIIHWLGPPVELAFSWDMVVAEFYGLLMVYGRYNCNYTVTIVFMGFTKQQTKPLGAPFTVFHVFHMFHV